MITVWSHIALAELCWCIWFLYLLAIQPAPLDLLPAPSPVDTICLCGYMGWSGIFLYQ